jgi:hypothetical protein
MNGMLRGRSHAKTVAAGQPPNGGAMSKELCSALRGSGVGSVIGFTFGLATLSTIGFANMTFFEGLLLLCCAIFGGVLFGSLIGVTGAFRKEPAEPLAEPIRSIA